MIQSRLFMPLLLMAGSQMMSAINISTGQAPSLTRFGPLLRAVPARRRFSQIL